MTDAPLVHYSDTPVAAVYSVAEQPVFFKPHGLWLSVEDGHGWADWCKGEEYTLGKIAHAVTLAPGANVLRLANADELRAFDSEFGTSPMFVLPGEAIRTQEIHMAVEWARVAERWQGVIIAPYIWSLRLDLLVSWYYPWDCSSGCIWDAAAIASITPIEGAEPCT